MHDVLFTQNKNLMDAGSWHSGLLQAILNPAFTGLAQRPFRPDFRSFATRSYKSLTVFLLSLFVLCLCFLKIGQDVSALILTAVGVGVGSVILSILVSREWKPLPAKHSVGSPAFSIRLSPDKAVAHVGSLIIGLLGLLFIYAKFHSRFAWTVYPTLSLLGGFALGFSGVMLCIYAVSRENSMFEKAKTPVQTYVIPERLDVLAGAVAASMILGTTLVEVEAFKDFSLSAGVVWMPAVLAWCGVCASWLTANVLKTIELELPPTIARMLNVFVMTVIAYVLVGNMLPGYWVIEGNEKLSSEIFLAAEIGIIGGFALLEISRAYGWLRTRYYAWVFRKSDREIWLFKPFRHTFRIVCLAVPVLLIAGFLTYAFEEVGLYGILVSSVAMLSNLNARLSFSKKAIVKDGITDSPTSDVVRAVKSHGGAKPVVSMFSGLVSHTKTIPVTSRPLGKPQGHATIARTFSLQLLYRPWWNRRFGGKSGIWPVHDA